MAESFEDREKRLNRARSLGQRSTINNEMLCNSTLRSKNLHLNLLSRNEVDLKNIMKTNINEMLDRLTDRKGKRLSDAYKWQIT